MIAGIDIAIMLDHHRTSAGRLMVADRSRRADEICECPFDIHDEHLTNIARDPPVKNGAQKPTIVFGNNRPVR